MERWERKIRSKYFHAYDRMMKRFKHDTREIQAKDEKMLKKVEAGEITKAEYLNWRFRMNLELQKQAKAMAEILNKADEESKDVANKEMPKKYTESYNHHGYDVEKDLKIETDFELVNVEAVQQTVAQRFFAKYDSAKNDAYNRRRISSAMTAAVIQGKSIPEIGKWLEPVCNGNKKAAIRNARTWITGAQNGGRMDAALEMKKLGVHERKIWLAVTDMRTRFSHRALDEEIREVDEPFSNGGMYPADPNLPPQERYNCRCRMRQIPDGFNPDLSERHVDIGDMTYDEWKAGKNKKVKKSGSHYEDEMAAKGHVGLSKAESDNFIDMYHNKNIIGKRGLNTMDGAMSHALNTPLRNGNEPTDPKALRMMQRLDIATQKNSLPYDMTLFRGAGQSMFKELGIFDGFSKIDSPPMEKYKDASGKMDWDAWSEAHDKVETQNLNNIVGRLRNAAGKTITDNGFMEVSASSERNAFAFSDIDLQIHAAKGTHAYISDYKDESEIILPRGTKLEIQDVSISWVTASNGVKKRCVQVICKLV